MFKSVVVGTDGSPTTTHAVKKATELAAGWGAVLHLVSAHTRSKAGCRRPRLVSGGGRVDTRSGLQGRRCTGQGRGGCPRGGVEATLHAPRGDPADALIAIAEREGPT
jgi:nucleotide-binding universal stress UspA family protein